MTTKYAIKMTKKQIMMSWTERADAFARIHKSRVYRMVGRRLATLWDTREEAEAFLPNIHPGNGPAVVEVEDTRA